VAIFLPGTPEDQALSLEEMTPRQIVAELDKYVVGQAAAKRAVAIALRNRARRQKLPPEMAEEIMPKNILMIGSTGVGKTEIARRLAKLTNSPFLKVEASKFTEVGYVGRDVESMVRDLVEIAIEMVREEKLEDVEDRAELAAEERLIELLLAQGAAAAAEPARNEPPPPTELVVEVSEEPLALASVLADAAKGVPPQKSDAEMARARERLMAQFRDGKLDNRMVELDTRDRAQPQIEVFSNQPPEDMDPGSRQEMGGIRDMLAGMLGQRTRKRPMKVADAFDYLTQEEESRLLDMDQVVRIAVERVEEGAFLFLYVT
jgi:ATP-dependent HslUV protease ATP-binding subunit HslU